MPLIETEGLVIKSYGLAEADRIVVLLTREHGIVRGVAKGAKKLKSKFGSGLEPFSVVNLSYFQKDAVELVSIQKAELVRSYFAAASDPDFLQKFSYLGDLLAAFSPPHDPNETLYRMARACLETTAADLTSLAAVGVYFELWLLRLAGYLPDWTRCDQCKRVLDDGESADVRTNFHLICTTCRRASGRPAGAGQRRLYSSAMRLAPTDFAASAVTQLDDIHELSATLKRIIAQAIGRHPVAEISLSVNN